MFLSLHSAKGLIFIWDRVYGIYYGVVDGIHLPQESDLWRSLVNIT